MKILTMLLFILVLMGSATVSWAQIELGEDLQNLAPNGHFIYKLSSDGKLSVNSSPIAHEVQFSRNYCGSQLQNELQLSNKQVQKINRLAEKIQESAPSTRMSPGEAEKIIESLVPEIKKLTDVYSNSQLERLREIQFRRKIATDGLESVCSHPEIRDRLGLTSNIEVHNKVKLALRIRSEEKAMLKECIKRFTGPLNAKQEEMFLAKWESKLTDECGAALLAMQLAAPEDFRGLIEEPEDMYTKFPQLQFYDLPLDSELGSRTSKFSKFENLNKLQLLFYFCKALGQEGLEMVGFQTTEVDELLARWSDLRKEANREIGSQMGLSSRTVPIYGTGSDVPIGEYRVYDLGNDPALLEKFNQRLDLKATRFLEELEQILLPVQFDNLESAFKKLFCNVSGPLVDLTDGQLGIDLALSEEQKLKLVVSAREARAFLLSESGKLFDSHISAMLTSVNEDDRNRIEKAIGDTTMHIFFDLHALSLIVENGTLPSEPRE